MEMAQIGGTPAGGCNRQALTEHDAKGRALFKSWCEDAGCTVSVDRLGHVRAGGRVSEDHLPPVMIGSHLDTQPTGGKFDGVLGVLAGLEVMRALKESGVKTRRPIELRQLDERGRLPLRAGHAGVGRLRRRARGRKGACREGPEGKIFGDELKKMGLDRTGAVGGRPVAAFVELHIEQGTDPRGGRLRHRLRRGRPGPSLVRRHLHGLRFARRLHADAAPARRDGGRGETHPEDREIGLAYGPAGVATVGEMHVEPNSRNIIPAEVRFTIDIRHPETATLEKMDADVRKVFEEVRRLQSRGQLLDVSYNPPVPFDAGVLKVIREKTAALGLKGRDIVSGGPRFLPHVEGLPDGDDLHARARTASATTRRKTSRKNGLGRRGRPVADGDRTGRPPVGVPRDRRRPWRRAASTTSAGCSAPAASDRLERATRADRGSGRGLACSARHRPRNRVVRRHRGGIVDAGADPTRAILFFHGGGYCSGSIVSHRRMATEAAARRRRACWLVEYRLAPEHPFPRRMTMRSRRGAGCARRDRGRASPSAATAPAAAVAGARHAPARHGRGLPGCLWLCSPWTDLTMSGATLETKDAVDPLIHRPYLEDLANAYVPAGVDRRDPRVSPLFGDLSGLPPMLIQVGSAEALLADATRLSPKAAGAAETAVTLEVWPHMIHAWHLWNARLPEARQALEQAGAFILARTRRLTRCARLRRRQRGQPRQSSG